MPQDVVLKARIVHGKIVDGDERSAVEIDSLVGGRCGIDDDSRLFAEVIQAAVQVARRDTLAARNINDRKAKYCAQEGVRSKAQQLHFRRTYP